jgi:hypothetical protein
VPAGSTDRRACNGGDDGCGGNLQRGDGDCDSDSDCAGDLKCGKDNCARKSGGDWDSTGASIGATLKKSRARYRGLYLIKALYKDSRTVDKTLDEIVGQAVSSLFGLDGNVEETCQEHLKIDFCNDVNFHSVSEEVHKKKNERDITAKETYDKIIESEVKGAGTTMKALTEENDACKKVVKQSLCLAAFPPCDCRFDIASCMNNCDLINECARLAKGDKTISICNSCINYCEKSFRLGSAHGLSIGVRHHANDLLFPILALAAFATFVSAVCNRF